MKADGLQGAQVGWRGGRVQGRETIERRLLVIARPVGGGAPIDVASADPSFNGSPAVDPRTGEIVYATLVDEQIDVGAVRLRES